MSEVPLVYEIGSTYTAIVLSMIPFMLAIVIWVMFFVDPEKDETKESLDNQEVRSQ